jgi:hypothetical protein
MSSWATNISREQGVGVMKMNAPEEPPTGAYSERNNDPASGNFPLLAPIPPNASSLEGPIPNESGFEIMIFSIGETELQPYVPPARSGIFSGKIQRIPQS